MDPKHSSSSNDTQADGRRTTGIGGMKIGGASRIVGRARGNPGLRAAAMGLGLFSIGLGLAELLAPRAVSRATGMPGRTTLLRAYGLREIVSGIGLLSSRDPRPWLWARVAGDALDVSTLLAHATGRQPLPGRAKVAMGLVLPVALLDLAYARVADSRARGREAAQFDYSDRVGLSGSPDALRGAARDFKVPDDMRAPQALRPYRGA